MNEAHNGERSADWSLRHKGELDEVRQQRAESVLGMWSYRLLASKLYRFATARSRIARLLFDTFGQLCLSEKRDDRLTAQLLLWSLHSHLFMHTEDLARLIYAVQRFALRWETRDHIGEDILVQDYLGLGAGGTGVGSYRGDLYRLGDPSGENPLSILRSVGYSKRNTDTRRALWLPARAELKKLHPGDDEMQSKIDRTVYWFKGVLRGICEALESGTGKEWYAMFLRYKHGAPLLALDLFHEDTRLLTPLPITREEAISAIKEEVSDLHMFLPWSPQEGRQPTICPKPWGFKCTREVAEGTFRADVMVAQLEMLIVRSVVYRAESEDTRVLTVVEPGSA